MDLPEIILDGHALTPSVHEREGGNAIIRFRIDKGKKQWGLSAGVRRSKQVTKALATSLLLDWWAKNGKRITEPPPAAVPALDLVAEIHRYISEEYQFQTKDHTDQVRTILLDMAALVPGKTVPEITRQVFREVIKPAMTKDIAAKTWANKRSYVKGFFDWEMDQEDDAGNPHIDRHPMQGDKPPDPRLFGTHEETWEFEDDTFQGVLAKVAADRRLAPEDRPRFVHVLQDLWFTGMDFKDLWELEPARHIIPVKVVDKKGAAKTGWKVYKARSKEWEIIDQPIDAPIRDRWAKAHAAAAPGEFLHPWARRYASPKSWGNQVRLAAQRARDALGLPHRDVKSIRHTFETRWARVFTESRGQKGPNPEEMRKWMGRAPGSTVGQEIYDKNKAWVDPDTL